MSEEVLHPTGEKRWEAPLWHTCSRQAEMGAAGVLGAGEGVRAWRRPGTPGGNLTEAGMRLSSLQPRTSLSLPYCALFRKGTKSRRFLQDTEQGQNLTQSTISCSCSSLPPPTFRTRNCVVYPMCCHLFPPSIVYLETFKPPEELKE